MPCLFTVLLVDLQFAVEVDAEDDQVRRDIECAEAVYDVRVFHRNLLGQLDQEEDDHQVGAAFDVSDGTMLPGGLCISHGGIHHVCDGRTVLRGNG